MSVCLLIAYHSHSGHVERLATCIERGASEVESVEVTIADITSVPPTSIHAYQGIVVGSPTRFGTISADTKAWLEGTYPLWERGALVGRVAGAFTVSAGPCGDRVLTLQALNHFLLMHGCVVVGNPRTDINSDLFIGAGAKVLNPKFGQPFTDDDEIRAVAFGRRIAETTVALHGG